MLSPGDAALVSRDPGLPGLPVLLDNEALSTWLGAQADRRYLRYKPGTSCVLGASIAGEPIFVSAYTDGGAGKFGKSLNKAPAGAIVASDQNRLLLAGLPAADRDLPALARLANPLVRATLLSRMLPDVDPAAAGLRTLAYKPQRRWVGLLTPSQSEPVVLRAYRLADAPKAVAATRELSPGPPSTPAALAWSWTSGLAVVQWLPGAPLDQALATGSAGPVDLAAVGAAVAALHSRRLGRLRVRPVEADVRGVRLAARQIAVLRPCLADRCTRLGDDLAARLRAGPGSPVTAHGDFSPDQVILGADGGIGFVDLDNAVAAEPALDLGSLSAALHSAAILSGARLSSAPEGVDAMLATLQDGYAGVSALPPPGRLSVHTAAALMRRAGDPFRLCLPDWPERVEALLTLAEAADRAAA